MPPKPLPTKSIATREFFGTDDTDAPSNNELEFPSPSLEVIPADTDKGKGKAKAEEKQRSRSPTPSEIVLRADLQDMGPLSELNAQMIRDEVGVQERRERLMAEQGEMAEGRETGFRRAEEEREKRE